MTKNDRAWQTYIQERQLQLDGQDYEIEAGDLRRVTGREPRLMTKFDTPNQLPRPLKDKHYAVLPIRNGLYLLFQGNIFVPVPPPLSPKVFTSNLDFPLLTAGRGSGEMQYLDYAFNTGLIAYFTGADPLYLTIRGREHTRPFRFRLKDKLIEVQSVQIEVDAGYEGEREVILVEAKIGHVSHFNIRQLYYPFRHFQTLVPTKQIRTLLLCYDLPTLTYSLYEFSFSSPEHFCSIKLNKQQTYQLRIMQAVKIEELIDPQFETVNNIVPQADDFNKVLKLVDAVDAGYNTPEAVADYFGFTERQSYYYAEAARFLGLLTLTHGYFELTDRALELLAASPEEQRDLIAKMVVNSWLFRKLIRIARKRGYFDLEDVENIIASVKRYSSSTVPRRCRTIESWLNWLVEQIGCFTREGKRYRLR